MLVKLNLTKDLLYVLELYISFALRLVVTLIIDNKYNLDYSYISLFMMILGEIFGGAAAYIYLALNQKKKKQVNRFGFHLLHYNNYKNFFLLEN